MFGTLIIVLPCEHTGGEVIVRHAGREVSLDLSSMEVSELRIAAFYADCEHEVRPVTGGHRVCLMYNLIQPRTGKGSRPLVAPTYHGEIEKAAATLREAFASDDAPAKLEAFARDQARREHRFRVNKERRQSLHQLIDRLGLDMTHVTERQGSPQTLVGTKTLRAFERRCAQHGADVAAMKALLAWPSERLGNAASRLAVRMNAASQRRPSSGPLKRLV